MPDNLMNFINEATGRRAVIAQKLKLLDETEADQRRQLQGIAEDRARYVALDAEYAEAIERAQS